MFWVGRWTDRTVRRNMFGSPNGVSSGCQVYEDGAGNIVLDAGTALSVASDMSVPHVGLVVVNGASSQIWKNDTLLTSGNAGSRSFDGVTIGGSHPSNNVLQGDFLEGGMTQQILTPDKRRAFVNMLRAKYGV
jgi:hypothetical protein